MAELWLPGAERNLGNNAGTMDGDGSRKLLLHDTEGSTIAGAVGAYTANNSWPHLTVDCRRRKVQQHLPFNVAARALRNESGGVQTNREGRYLVQIELVGFANNRDGSIFGSLGDYDWFGREVAGPICRGLGIPLRSTVQWARYPDSYGKHAPQRLSGGAWDAYEGILGHQHCPENTHGDPGTIDITRILRAAAGATTPVQEDDMPSAQEVVAEFADELTAGQQTKLRRNMVALINGELDKRDWGTRPLLVQAEKGGPVYVYEGDRGGRWLVSGWDNVRALVAFYNVSADGEEAGHPKPWPIPQTLLDAIPETDAPTPEAS
jgi:hypothetical protein